MIPASKKKTIPPCDAVELDVWTPVLVQITRTGVGSASATVRLTRAKQLPDGNSELSTDPADTVEMSVSNIYGPPTDTAEYPAAVKSLVLSAVEPLVRATAALAQAREVV